MDGKSIERRLKKAGIALLRTLAPRARGENFDLASVRRILVLRPDERIGNMMLISPLLVEIKRAFPRAELVCMVSRKYEGLFPYMPKIDRYLFYDKHRLARRPWEYPGLVRRLRRERFDLVFETANDHQESFTHLALGALSGGRLRVGHARGAAYDIYELPVPIPEQERHAVAMHLDLLRALTPIGTERKPELFNVTETGIVESLHHDATLHENRPFLIVHPGARGRKRWSPENFAAVVERLMRQGEIDILAVWGPADQDAADQFLRLAGDKVHPLGVLPFDDLITVMRHAAVFVSGDCGPMHLAAAAGTPVVAAFLASSIDKYRTLGTHDHAIDGRVTPPSPERVAECIHEVLLTTHVWTDRDHKAPLECQTS